MTLKALLMGSAAAMIAVSGAKAADAVVAEPEAVEYVKVCDTYGAGFYYIPGTETCLNINGYVRIDYEYDSADIAAGAVQSTVTAAALPVVPGGDVTLISTNPVNGLNTYNVLTPTAARNSTSSWSARASVNIDARNETDYGTLRSQIRFQADSDGTGGNPVYVDRALISIGGLRVGYSDNFWSTNHGYGLPIAINSGSGYYGFGQSIFLDYTYAANGFSVTVGVEDANGVDDTTGFSMNAEEPNIYGGASYSGSWGNVAATVAYDSIAEDTAYKASAQFNVFEGFVLKGFYAGDGGDNTSYVGGAGEWAWGVGVSYAATDALDLYAGYADRDGTDAQYWNVGANYDITSGLRIQGEVNVYDESEDFRLRLQRTF